MILRTLAWLPANPRRKSLVFADRLSWHTFSASSMVQVLLVHRTWSDQALESKVRFADNPETNLPVSTRALVIQRYFQLGRHQSSSISLIPIRSPERMLQDIFCNCSTRCQSVITRRAEVNAATCCSS
jgi:hypothetical protein